MVTRRTSTGFDLKTASGVITAADLDAAAAKPKAAKSVSEAAATGTKRELLVALRSRVATSVQDPKTPARDLAALTRRLQDIANEIEAIDAREEQEARRETAATDGAFDASAV